MELFRLLLCFALGLSGCVKSVFEPYSGLQPRYPRAVERAQQVYEGDIQELVDRGAIRVGYLSMRGNGWMDTQDLDARASVDAAKAGGTHFMRIAAGTDHSIYVTPTQATSQTNSWGRTTTTVSGGQVYEIEKPTGEYTVIRLLEWDQVAGGR